jgi:purine-nucleoside phosphorylase
MDANIYKSIVELAGINGEIPKNIPIGIICGSGLGGIVDDIENSIKIAYTDIPGLPKSTVKGHSGNLVLGKIQGIKVICFSGRLHYYEGYSMSDVTLPVRLMAMFGVNLLIVTNASGSLDPEKFGIGDIVMIRDHISFPSLTGLSPLIGGPNFASLTSTYLQEIQLLTDWASKLEIPIIKQGIYVGVGGPNYETPAEVKFMRMIGGGIVGMSTTPEVIMAASLNMKVLGISLVTNICIDDPGKFQLKDYPHHLEVLRVSKERGRDLQRLIVHILGELEKKHCPKVTAP